MDYKQKYLKYKQRYRRSMKGGMMDKMRDRAPRCVPSSVGSGGITDTTVWVRWANNILYIPDVPESNGQPLIKFIQDNLDIIEEFSKLSRYVSQNQDTMPAAAIKKCGFGGGTCYRTTRGNRVSGADDDWIMGECLSKPSGQLTARAVAWEQFHANYTKAKKLYVWMVEQKPAAVAIFQEFQNFPIFQNKVKDVDQLIESYTTWFGTPPYALHWGIPVLSDDTLFSDILSPVKELAECVQNLETLLDVYRKINHSIDDRMGVIEDKKILIEAVIGLENTGEWLEAERDNVRHVHILRRVWYLFHPEPTESSSFQLGYRIFFQQFINKYLERQGDISRSDLPKLVDLGYFQSILDVINKKDNPARYAPLEWCENCHGTGRVPDLDDYDGAGFRPSKTLECTASQCQSGVILPLGARLQ